MRHFLIPYFLFLIYYSQKHKPFINFPGNMAAPNSVCGTNKVPLQHESCGAYDLCVAGPLWRCGNSKWQVEGKFGNLHTAGVPGGDIEKRRPC